MLEHLLEKKSPLCDQNSLRYLKKLSVFFFPHGTTTIIRKFQLCDSRRKSAKKRLGIPVYLHSYQNCSYLETQKLTYKKNCLFFSRKDGESKFHVTLAKKVVPGGNLFQKKKLPLKTTFKNYLEKLPFETTFRNYL